MAIYHKGLEYHEDTVKKHAIKKEELDFLVALQREMNTQDTLATADPRFWVIRGKEKVYGVHDDNADGAELQRYGIKIAECLEDACEFIVKNLLGDINKDGTARIVTFEDESIYVTDQRDTTILHSMVDVVDWLEGHGYNEFKYTNYCIADKIYPNTMFLTQLDAEKHLKMNHYHYSADAHTYCMTSWRSEETLKLWKILQEVDWQQLSNSEKIINDEPNKELTD